MKFSKDILVIDFEGLIEPVQIGAVLLDKETLEEKDNFSSYIWAELEEGTVKSITGITQQTLKGAPSQAEVGKKFFEKFGTDVFIAPWVAQGDMRNFEKIIIAAGIDMKQYDYHVLDIWPIAYIHLLKRGYIGSVRSEPIFKEFNVKLRGLHDALEDCRIAADILRKITTTNE